MGGGIMAKLILNDVSSLIDATTSATTINNNSAAIETAMENTLSRDGTSPNTMSSSLDMNSNRVLNLPAPVADSEPARYIDVLDVALGTFATPLSVPNGGTGTTTSTGTGSTVRSISPTLTTPTLTSATLTSPTMTTPALGTPTSGTLTNTTGLPISTGVSGLGTNIATFLGTPSSANLAAAVTNETGSGALVFATSPALTTPTGIVKGDVGLGNVDNTSDATKNSASVTLTGKTFNTASNTFTVNAVSLDTAWTSYTPTVTSGSGSFTTVSATGAYKQIGKTVIFRARVNITTNGTAAGRVEATIPVAVGGGTDSQALCGQNNSSAAVISVAITPGVSTTKALVFTATGAYPGADATVLLIGGSYEVP